MLLVEVLSEAPVIEKLDLSGNWTSDKSAICIIRLLILQAKQVRETPIEERMTAVYLGQVLVNDSKSPIEVKVLEDITMVTGALQHTNAKTRIKHIYQHPDGYSKVRKVDRVFAVRMSACCATIRYSLV